MSTIIVANWKMNPPTLKEAKQLFDATKKMASSKRSIEIVVAPPSVYLQPLAHAYKGTRVSFAAQHVHYEETGSFTGDVSVPQVKDAGAQYCIVGHSERRAVGETNADVRKKTKAVVDANLTAVICIGEKERDSAGVYLQGVREQIIEGIADISKKQLKQIIVAYEPVWAVGVEDTMRPQDMHEMSIYIRKILNEVHGSIGMSVPVLYGGSVNEVHELLILKEGDINGILIGRASTDSEVFTTLLGHI